MHDLVKILDRVVRVYAERRNCALPIPAWLQKQAEAVQLIGQDPQRGLALLGEGLQDELDTLTELFYD